MSKVVRFVTLGCKVNQYETNAMAQKFLEKGYKIIEEIKKFKTVHNISLNEKVLVITYKKGKNNLGELIDFLKENNVKYNSVLERYEK